MDSFSRLRSGSSPRVPSLERPGGGGERGQRRVARGLVALGAQAGELGDLLGAHRRVVDLEHVDVVGRVGPEAG